MCPEFGPSAHVTLNGSYFRETASIWLSSWYDDVHNEAILAHYRQTFLRLEKRKQVSEVRSLVPDPTTSANENQVWLYRVTQRSRDNVQNLFNHLYPVPEVLGNR